MQIRRGTTPTITFTLPFSGDYVDELWLTIAQRGKEILTKVKADMVIVDTAVTVPLTQEETLLLSSTAAANYTGNASIQVRGRTAAGEAFASQVVSVEIGAILKDGVI